MHKSLILGARMRNKAEKVVELEESIKELNKRSELEAKKLDQAGNDEEVSAVEKNLEDIQKELDEKLAEKEQLEKEIEDLQNQVEELNRKAPTYPSQEKRGGQKLEKRDAVLEFIRSRGQNAQVLKQQM